jgi:hypothetical protein
MNLRVLFVAAGGLWTAGCAIHTPEHATTLFIHALNAGLATSDGTPAFEKARMDLRLKKLPAKNAGKVALRKSASWSHGKQHLELVSSNILQDPPDRFDLRLSWYPPRRLRTGLLEELLGAPYGTSATWDNGWVIHGGMLEYRAVETETPYLVFSSPGYTRDPLDFLEAADLPHLPSLASVRSNLERNGAMPNPLRAEEGYLQAQAFDLQARNLSVVLYSSADPRHPEYLVGIEIRLPGRGGLPPEPADFLPILTTLDIPAPDQLTAAVFRGVSQHSEPIPGGDTEHYQVYNNFALDLAYPKTGEAPGDTTLSVWRRIESPRSWCRHLRPDLERCSDAPR